MKVSKIETAADLAKFNAQLDELAESVPELTANRIKNIKARAEAKLVHQQRVEELVKSLRGITLSAIFPPKVLGKFIAFMEYQIKIGVTKFDDIMNMLQTHKNFKNFLKDNNLTELPKEHIDQLRKAFYGKLDEVLQKRILANSKAKELINNVKEVKDVVENDLITIVTNKTNGKLEGLEYSVKGEESLTRKINDRVDDKIVERFGIEKAINKSASKMNDVLRFTFVSDPLTYVDDYFKIVRELETLGYKKSSRSFNAWFKGDGSYRGLNTTFETPLGQQFELQFHTSETFKIKSETHHLYETSRLKTTSKEIENANNLLQKEAYKDIELPKNINQLKDE